MNLPENSFKRALRAGKPQIGLWSSLSSNYTVEVIAGAGFDWILLDSEHSPADIENLLTQLQAAAPYATHPVVRIPWNDMVTIKRVLDIGAQSLLVPYVSTPNEAKAAVSFTRYPPAGVRGVAGTTRATRFGRVADYARRAHEEICLLVQVETQQALDNIEAHLRSRRRRRRIHRTSRPARLARPSGRDRESQGETADRRRHPPHPQSGQSARHPDAERGRRAPLARVRRAVRRGRRRRRHPGARR